MFTSDHGEAFGEHGQWDHRRSLHEEELLVPWVLRWPQVVRDDSRLDVQVSLLDLAPTLLGLARVAIPAGWQGRDLSALCRGASRELRRTEPLFIDTVHASPIDGVTHSVAALLWPHKLIASLDDAGTLQPRALYRLDDDPAELSNRLGDPAAKSVEQTLTAWLTERLRQESPHADGLAAAPSFDPALREWMVQMGYLR
jgi:arylsulfatase A-like enzyme